ncbi:MAG TPA: hypothetical protein VFB58_08350 [Chloroflexota bacterium]|nr:hypothetical protein [Chloroflexota bacterium]
MKSSQHPGGGGTFVSTTSHGGTSGHTIAGGAPTQLPTTGGGAGGNPSSPLAPLSLLAAAAIAAGRTLPRLIKR